MTTMNQQTESRWQMASRRSRTIVESARTRAVLSLGLVLGLGVFGTMAVWSDTAKATSGTFSTGTVNLQVNNTKSFPFTNLTLTGMLPGESRAATLQVQNKGTIPLTYTMTATTPATSPALAGYLEVTVFPGAAPTNVTTNGMRIGGCAGAPVGQARLTAAGSVNVITGTRSLAGTSGIDNLCFVTKLVNATPRTVQSQTLNFITFTFSATTL